uniref:Uncharacterized protein n=1 Tax=Arundo donax TaxID=35708 RepID=A0A0A9GE40_ARUDO
MNPLASDVRGRMSEPGRPVRCSLATCCPPRLGAPLLTARLACGLAARRARGRWALELALRAVPASCSLATWPCSCRWLLLSIGNWGIGGRGSIDR